MQNNYDGASFFTSNFSFSNSGYLNFSINFEDKLLFFGINKMSKLSVEQDAFRFDLAFSGGDRMYVTLGTQQYL